MKRKALKLPLQETHDMTGMVCHGVGVEFFRSWFWPLGEKLQDRGGSKPSPCSNLLLVETFSSSNLSFSKTRLLQRPDRNRIISWLYKPNAPHQCNSVRQDSNLATMELKALYLPSGQLLRTIRFLICKYQAWIHNKKPLRQTTWY